MYTGKVNVRWLWGPKEGQTVITFRFSWYVGQTLYQSCLQNSFEFQKYDNDYVEFFVKTTMEDDFKYIKKTLTKNPGKTELSVKEARVLWNELVYTGFENKEWK